jgi:hypothetical protein
MAHFVNNPREIIRIKLWVGQFDLGKLSGQFNLELSRWKSRLDRKKHVILRGGML